MKWCVLSAMMVLGASAWGQSYDQKVQAYIDTYHTIAIEEQWRTGVPASIKLAQGILESGLGEGTLAQRSNNHFGIKCKNTWTGAAVYHDDDERGECFRAYGSVAESYRDHSDFLRGNQRYAFLFTLSPADYQAWAWGLKKAGYATNPVYSQNLIRVIENYGLAQYTDLALNRQPGTPDWVVKNTVATEEVLVNPTEPKNTSRKAADEADGIMRSAVVRETAYPTGVFSHEGIKAIYVKQGTALLALAQNHGMSLGDLLRLNDMPSTSFAEQDQLIFLEKKKKKNAQKTYTCTGGESPWMVSQMLGVQLKELLKINALEANMVLRSGQVVKAG